MSYTQGYKYGTLEEKATAEAFMAEHGFEVDYRDSDDAITSYSAEYFCENESAGDLEQSARYMGVADAHDIQIDGMSKTVAHGQYRIDALCYAPLDVKDLRDTRGALVNMDTRDATLKANRAHRAEQFKRHIAKPAKGYAKQIASAKADAKAKAKAAKLTPYQRRLAAKEAHRAKMAAELTPRFTDAESNAARAERAADKRLDDYLNQ
jgi:hypothetical protein